MFFFVLFGTHTFTSRLKGYENITAQCQNCGNWAAICQSSWQWFTLCFIPVLPLGSKHKDVHCPVCRTSQDLKHRPDVQSQQGNPQGGGPPPPGQAGPPQQGYYK